MPKTLRTLADSLLERFVPKTAASAFSPLGCVPCGTNCWRCCTGCPCGCID